MLTDQLIEVLEQVSSDVTRALEKPTPNYTEAVSIARTESKLLVSRGEDLLDRVATSLEMQERDDDIELVKKIIVNLAMETERVLKHLKSSGVVSKPRLSSLGRVDCFQSVLLKSLVKMRKKNFEKFGMILSAEGEIDSKQRSDCSTQETREEPVDKRNIDLDRRIVELPAACIQKEEELREPVPACLSSIPSSLTVDDLLRESQSLPLFSFSCLAF
jgi:hypothetical protein